MATIIQQLKEENARLRAEKLQTEKDMAFVANTVKNAWNELGFDFSDMAEKKKGEKMTMSEIAKISLSVGRKLISGKIKIQDLVDKWDQVTPIMKKYEHVIETQKLD